MINLLYYFRDINEKMKNKYIFYIRNNLHRNVYAINAIYVNYTHAT